MHFGFHTIDIYIYMNITNCIYCSERWNSLGGPVASPLAHATFLETQSPM